MTRRLPSSSAETQPAILRIEGSSPANNPPLRRAFCRLRPRRPSRGSAATGLRASANATHAMASAIAAAEP